MKISQILSVALIALAFTACGKKMAESLSPETTKIDGNMGGYFELVEGSYPLSEHSSEFSFDIKRVDEDYADSYTKLGIGYEILDGKGNVLVRKNATLEDINPLSSHEFLSLREGEMGKVKIYLEGWPDKLADAKTFRISINAREGEPDVVEPVAVAEDYDDDYTGPVADASNNWDSILDEYERYCDKIVSLYKKAMAGDMSAMSDYASAMEQAQRLSEKLQGAQSNLTPAQAQRLTRIATKMSQSVM
ncbi:MAG: hypothetical protein K2H98_04355 [Duncaniella sp.]|nr:hypothetical protein [Duncaniella sp.]